MFALFGQCLFMATFSVGFGPITWVYSSEIFPLKVRGVGMGVSTFVNRVTSGIIAMSFLSMVKVGSMWVHEEGGGGGGEQEEEKEGEGKEGEEEGEDDDDDDDDDEGPTKKKNYANLPTP